MPSVNATHRKRLARALAAQQGITYLAALDQVTKAAAAGLLPKRLDDAGMAAALRVLTSGATTTPAVTPSPSAAAPQRRIASDPRDQQIYDLSAVYEQETGQQGLVYISSPGSGKDRYVFGGEGGGHVCLGRDEALAYISGLVTEAGLHWREPGKAPVLVGGECQHTSTEYRAQDGTYCEVCGEQLATYQQIADADGFHLEKSYLRLLRQVWQGRVTWEPYGVRTPGFRFAIDNEPASDIKDIELRWLRDNGYLTHHPLADGDEWATVRTTDFGDDVLAFHGAARDKFADGLPQPAKRAPRPGPRTFTLKHSDIQRCPKKSLEVGHYRNDGTCLCTPGPAPDGGFSVEGASTATVRGLLRVREEFVKAGRVEWWWHTGPFAGSHGFKTVEGVDEEDGSIIFRDEDPDWMEPVTRLSLDFIDDPEKATRHLMWPDHTGVTFCDKRTGEIDASYRVAPEAAPARPARSASPGSGGPSPSPDRTRTSGGGWKPTTP